MQLYSLQSCNVVSALHQVNNPWERGRSNRWGLPCQLVVPGIIKVGFSGRVYMAGNCLRLIFCNNDKKKNNKLVNGCFSQCTEKA